MYLNKSALPTAFEFPDQRVARRAAYPKCLVGWVCGEGFACVIRSWSVQSAPCSVSCRLRSCAKSPTDHRPELSLEARELWNLVYKVDFTVKYDRNVIFCSEIDVFA